MSPVKPRSVFFMPPGAISVVQYSPSNGFRHKIYDLSQRSIWVYFSSLLASLLSILLNQLCHKGGPAGLMAGAYARAVIAVEILVEGNQVAPVWIILKLLGAAEDRPPAILVARKDPGQSLRNIARDLP